MLRTVIEISSVIIVAAVKLMMISILHYRKDPKLWESMVYFLLWVSFTSLTEVRGDLGLGLLS